MRRYPKIRRPGHSSVDALFTSDEHELILTEKFDGNNFRFCRDGDDLLFGSRNQVIGSDPDTAGDMFEDVAAHVAETVDPDELAQLETWWAQQYGDAVDSDDVTITLYGENAVQHTISEYDWEQVPQFQLFDILVEYADKHEWLRWGLQEAEKERQREQEAVLDDHPLTFFTVEDIADWLGLTTVPVVDWTTVGAFDPTEFEVPSSVYRTDDGPAEGVVIRNPTTRQKAKVIAEEFAERHKSAKSANIDHTDNDVEAFIHGHVTAQRIEKNAAKLLEEPNNGHDEFGMELMEDLHWLVWEDVWVEDYEEIIATDWVIDMDRAHNQTASKCASHLQQLLRAGETPVQVIDPDRGETVDPDTLESSEGAE